MKPPSSLLLCAIAWSIAATGCYETPEFTSDSLVDRPRILAVVADPPEVTPSTSVGLRVLVAGAGDVSVQWRACSTFSSFNASGAQYGENTGDRGCAANSMALGSGSLVQVPREIIAVLLADDRLVTAALGGVQLPAGTLEQVRNSVGVAFSLEAEVNADGKRLRALKRVVVSYNPQPGTNPPPPAFRIGERAVRARDVESFLCTPDEPEPVRVEPGQEVELAPLFDGPEEPWLETYNVLDGRGMLGERREQGFYSWYASRGQLDDGTTQAPDRTNRWRAPASAGCAQLWLVVRDGHAGESACGVSVSVGDVDNCGP